MTVTIQGGDQIAVDGSSEVTLTFDATNWWIPQSVTVTASDDLIIEGNVPADIVHTFSSTDGEFDGLAETHAVTVIDNDFQRTLEPEKLPSDGNNYVIYDSADGDTATTGTNQYSLGAGNDLLTVSGDLWDANNVQQRLFLGGAGNDTLSGVIQADGQDGNDTIISATTGNFVSVRFNYSSNNRTVGYDLQVLAGEGAALEEHEAIRFVGLKTISQTGEIPIAELSLEYEGEPRSSRAEGDGLVDAAFKAVEEVVPGNRNLMLYSVNAITAGSDSQGEVSVRLQEDGRVVNGQGADTDIVVASVKAYINGVNKLQASPQRFNPQSGETI